MGLGISLFLIAVGGVLAFAVRVPASGIDLDVVGVILMALGFATLLYTLIWWSDVMPWRRERTVVRRRYVERPVHEAVVHEPVVHEPVVHEPVVHEPVVHERRVIEYEERAS